MSNKPPQPSRSEHLVKATGVYRHGHIDLQAPVDWPEGTRVAVQPIVPGTADSVPPLIDSVIIAGFGLAGRCVADLIEAADIPCVIIERNPVTVETQRALGRHVLEGDISDEQTLIRAGVKHADVLALTVPEEPAVLAATQKARQLNPDIYIIARTNYASRGMQAARLGADDVVKSELAVAQQFYAKLKHKLEHHDLGRQPKPVG